MKLDEFSLRFDTGTAKASAQPPRPRPGEHFLKGPVPMGWLQIAATQADQSMAVAIFIWYMAGVKRSTEFALPTGKVGEYGVNRFKLYRDLAALEKAGLIAVERHSGRHPRVKLLPAPSFQPGESK